MAREAVRLEGPLDLELPDGSVVTLRTGPYGKGVAIVPTTRRWRERSKGGGGPGRPPREGTAKLRERLASDHANGGLHPARHYYQWLRNQDPSIRESVARQIVYRELRTVRGGSG